MKATSLARSVLLLLVSLAVGASPVRADRLFFGNDGDTVIDVTDTAGTLQYRITTGPITGIAFNGTNFYFSQPFTGVIEKRTADGKTVLDTFTVPSANGPGALTEDMAWDPKRQRLWRLSHSAPDMERINVTTKMRDQVFSLPTKDPMGTLTPLGALGIAYDSLRDQLDVSFCQAGCGRPGGILEAFNPDTGADLGTLFRSDTEYFGGLGYDPVTDTLWMGGSTFPPNFVSHFTRSGVLLSRFNTPDGIFADGLEFVIPEPGSMSLLLVGGAVLCGCAWRSRRRN